VHFELKNRDNSCDNLFLEQSAFPFMLTRSWGMVCPFEKIGGLHSLFSSISALGLDYLDYVIIESDEKNF